MQQRRVTEKYLFGGMVVSMFLWGLSWPSGKILTRYCSAVNFSVYRYIVVVSTLVLLLPFVGVSVGLKKKGIPIVLISGVLLACYGYFFFMGLKNGSPGAGGILVTTLNPLVAYLIGAIMTKRRPVGNEAIGLSLGLVAGLVLLKVWDGSVSLLASGNVYFLLAATTWAVMSKFTSRGAQYGSSLGFSLWQYVITLLCLLPFADFHEMRFAIHISDALFWANLFFSSTIVTALATTIYFYTTTRLDAEKASSFMFLVPLAAAVSSWLFLGERILPHTAVGGMLGMVAVYVMNRKSK
jgi:drug/metabolite transporter (DMT)-like permease